MRKNKLIYLFIALFLIAACTTTKNSASKTNISKKYSSEIQIKGERLYFNGLKEKIKENHEISLRNFEQAVKTYPYIDAAYYEISLLKYEEKDYATALKNIESALKIDATNTWYRELYAELLSANKKYSKAVLVFKKLREENPYKIDYYYNEAFFLLKDQKNKEALKVYNLLEEKTGIQEELSNEKFLIYLKESNFKGAENELEKLSEAFPNNLKYLNKLASFELSNNKAEKAIEIYKKILKINPDDAKALMSIADYYRIKGDGDKYDFYSKKAFLNKKINIDTKIAILYVYIQQSEKDKSKLKDAFEYVELLAKSHPDDAKTWAIYGDIYNLDNQTEKALVQYKKSLTIRKDIFSVWQQMFFIESDEKNYDLLIVDTEEAKEFFPNQSLVYFFNGLGYQQKKDYLKSNKAYEKGVKITFKNTKLKFQYYSNLAENYYDLKEYKKSDENFEKALEIEPNNQFVLNNYAYYLSIREEKLERAKEMSLKSLELSPENSTYLDTYAWILYKNKEYVEALKNQQKAIQLSNEPSAALYEHLGDIYFKLGNIDNAVSNWKKAKEKGGDDLVLSKKILNKKID